MLGLRGELGAVETVGKYRIVLPLGQGGTADVYLAVADGPERLQQAGRRQGAAQEPRQRRATSARCSCQRGAPRRAPAPPEHRPDQRGHRGRRRAGARDGVPRRPAAVAGDRARQAGRLHAGDAAARAGRRARGAARGARAGRLRRHAARRRAPRRLAPQPVRHASRARRRCSTSASPSSSDRWSRPRSGPSRASCATWRPSRSRATSWIGAPTSTRRA